MANNNKRQVFGRLGWAIVLAVGALWAAGLTPLAAFGPAPDTKVTAAPQLKTLAAKAGRRITTITIETSDPVAYLTNRPDPLTLAASTFARSTLDRGPLRRLSAKGVIAGATIEDAIGADGARVARVRIRLTQPAAHQVRSKRNVIYVDLDSAFPLGAAGLAPNTAAGVDAGTVCDLSGVCARRWGTPRCERHAHRQRRAVGRLGDAAWRRNSACGARFPECPIEDACGNLRGTRSGVGGACGNDRRRADDPCRHRFAPASELPRGSSRGRRKGVQDLLRGRRTGRTGCAPNPTGDGGARSIRSLAAGGAANSWHRRIARRWHSSSRACRLPTLLSRLRGLRKHVRRLSDSPVIRSRSIFRAPIFGRCFEPSRTSAG